MNQRSVEFEQRNAVAAADVARALHDKIEHRLWIARGGCHNLQHVNRGGLMGDPLAVITFVPRQRRVALGPQRRDFGSKTGDRVISSRSHDSLRLISVALSRLASLPE